MLLLMMIPSVERRYSEKARKYVLPRRRQKCAKSVLPMGRGPFESGKVHAAAGTAKQTPVEAH